MTIDEANDILSLLKRGKELSTRHQEDEWGLRYVKEDCFEKWSRRGFDPENSGETVEILNEIEASSLLTKWYSYNTILSKLK